MATSVVGICNIGLTEIGAATISSLTENSKSARKCAAAYELLRDATLRDHQWSFATWRKRLARRDEEVLHPTFTIPYDKPTDCLRIWEVGDHESPWKIEGQTILSAYEDAAALCTFRVDDPTRFDTSFVYALGIRMAWHLAVVLKGKQRLSTDLWQAYLMLIEHAQVNDAGEALEEVAGDDRYIRARG